MFLPIYRGWVVIFSLVVCLATWFLIEKTQLGAYLRAATENPTLVRAFGINVPRMITLTYGLGVGLAALAVEQLEPAVHGRREQGADAQREAPAKVVLARALLVPHGDLEHAVGVASLLRLLADQGRGLLVAAHDLNLLAPFAHRCVLLHEGKVFADGAPADVLTDANIETVFSVRSMTPTGRFPRDFRSLQRP
jgi:hypothetical protein